MKKISLKNIAQWKNNGEEKREINLENFFFLIYVYKKKTYHITFFSANFTSVTLVPISNFHLCQIHPS